MTLESTLAGLRRDITALQQRRIVRQESAAGSPAGTVVAWSAAAIPTGWLLCNGQAVSRTTYSALFAVIGTTFGAGDGSTTFNVPNLTERPQFYVEATSAQAIAVTTVVLLNSAWGTPAVNSGFTSWSGGVLTVKHAGWYQITLHAAGNAGADTGVITAGGRTYYLDSSSQSTVNTVTRYLAAGATIDARLYSTVGTTVQTLRTDFGVTFLGDSQFDGVLPNRIIKTSTSSGNTVTEVDTVLGARVVALEDQDNWERVIPAAVVSAGSVATVDPVTGIITVPAACTSIRVDNVFQAGYEYMIRTREIDAFPVFTTNMQFRFCTAGTPYSGNAHNLGGRWSQYDGTNGQYALNASTYLAVGIGYTAGGTVHREITIFDAAEATRQAVLRFWNYTFGAARETTGTGSTVAAAHDGFQLFPAAGSFQGSVSIYRRRMMV